MCKFLLENVIHQYRCARKIVDDRGELNANEAWELLSILGIKVSLTTTYNLEANEKIEWGHSPIVQALVWACAGKIVDWPWLLSYALRADIATHSFVTWYIPSQLMYGQKPKIPIEESITLWVAMPFNDEIGREDLLAIWISKLE